MRVLVSFSWWTQKLFFFFFKCTKEVKELKYLCTLCNWLSACLCKKKVGRYGLSKHISNVLTAWLLTSTFRSSERKQYTWYCHTIFSDFLLPFFSDLSLARGNDLNSNRDPKSQVVSKFSLFPLFKFKSSGHISRWLYCKIWKIVPCSPRTFLFLPFQ